MTTPSSPIQSPEFDWKQHPEVGAMVNQLVADACEDCQFLASLKKQMRDLTGTRLVDWVDHLAVGEDTELNDGPFEAALGDFGFLLHREDAFGRWYVNEAGLFPEICIHQAGARRLALKVDSVLDFLAAHRIPGVEIEGIPGGRLRRACAVTEGEFELWVVERHGCGDWEIPETSAAEVACAARHLERFQLRQRHFENDADGFALAQQLVREAVADLGVDWTCDLFFESERRYWQRRNHAARVQKGRQDRLGLGWANHDHHTYRSSRRSFADLIATLELLGFQCRERFYAGEEAGWGAQVLEQPGVGIVIFADVDLSPQELAGDFAHQGLAAKEGLGTVGLWCQLHGEAFLQAGMHHLECTFDFDAATSQLREAGVESMAPFTNFPHLRQAFTVGEVWKTIPSRTLEAVELGAISREQADAFTNVGTIGSHLEILERNDGFKGFNQTGVSQIILKTDPRKSVS